VGYLPDTNVWIAVLRANHPGVTARMSAPERRNDTFLCSIVQAELYYGAYRSAAPTKNLALLSALFPLFPSLPFDDKSADVYGKIRADLERIGKVIGPHDLMIAAIALANDLTLVTHNVSEFSRVPGLKIEDWQTP
jgi:tRNA(fMet)-specific endonuclease VapC